MVKFQLFGLASFGLKSLPPRIPRDEGTISARKNETIQELFLQERDEANPVFPGITPWDGQ